MPGGLTRSSHNVQTSREMLHILGGFGFKVESMQGSHAKLVRVRSGDDGREVRQVLVVPVQQAPRIGTVRAIYRQASRFIPEEELRPHFFG